MSGQGTVLVKTYNNEGLELESSPGPHGGLATDKIDLCYVNQREVFRYAGIPCSAYADSVSKTGGERSDSFDRAHECLIECVKEISTVITYKVCYREVDVIWRAGSPQLSFDTYESRNLKEVLGGCEKAVLMAATIGMGVDRLITKYEKVAPLKALIMQALGSERVERLCDKFNQDIINYAIGDGYDAKPRFSPGYGDLPLKVQTDFMSVLDCAHLIGINLNESLLMSPSKSVTAIIGLSSTEERKGEHAFDSGMAYYKSREYDKSREMLELALAFGISKAALYIGDMYGYGYGVRQDQAKAVEYYTIAGQDGVAEAKKRLNVIINRYEPEKKEIKIFPFNC